MTSSDGKRSKFSRRFLWLAAFVVLLFAGYSAGWFYLANRLEREANAVIVGLNRDGITAECANLDVRGYPFRLGVYCDSLGYADFNKDIVATAGGLRSAAQIYRPSLVVGELDAPVRAAIPGIVPLWLDWDNLRASVRISSPTPQRVSVAVEGLSAQTDPDDGEPQSLLSAEGAEAHFRPNGANVDGAFRFTGLQLDPPAAGGRNLPILAGSGDATLKDGLALINAGTLDIRSLRGRSVEIRSLELSSGDGAISIAGPVSVDADGLVDAQLTIRVRNPQVVASTLANIFPEQAQQIRTSFAGLAALGKEPALPLKIVKGEMTLGFIPLGKMPAL
jgi:hypothetical protein